MITGDILYISLQIRQSGILGIKTLLETSTEKSVSYLKVPSLLVLAGPQWVSALETETVQNENDKSGMRKEKERD